MKPATSAPFFSVVIPLYNKEQYVRRCLDSVLAQTFSNFEIVVVNDGSTDNSASVVASYRDPRIRMVQQPNSGVSAARNRGIAEARGAWIAFLDADDEYRPEFLRRVQECSQAFPQAEAAFARAAWMKGQHQVNIPRDCGSAPILLRDYLHFVVFEGGYEINSSAVALRPEVFLRTGLFPVGIKIGEDSDMWLRLAWTAEIAYVPEFLSVYHMQDGASNWERSRGHEPYWVQTYRCWMKEGRIPFGMRRSSAAYYQKYVLENVLTLALHGRKREAVWGLLQGICWRSAPKKLALKTAAYALLPTGILTSLRGIFRPRSGAQMTPGLAGTEHVVPHSQFEQKSSSRLRVAAQASYWLGVSRLFYFLNRNRKRVLSFHNVLPDSEFSCRLHEGVSHSASVFRHQVAYLASRFRLGTNLDDPRELTLTFDDGYRNQHAIAHPILMQFGVAAYFFCTLDLITGSQPLLIDLFLLWFSYVKTGVYTIFLAPEQEPLTLRILEDTDRHRCWQLVYAVLLKEYKTRAPHLYRELDRCHPFADLVRKIDRDYFTLRFTSIQPQALQAMKGYGHLVGANGKTHVPLSALERESIHRELTACAQEIGRTFNTSVFGFPFGGPEELAGDVEKYGFTRALANVNYPLPQGRSYSKFCIPRLALPNTSNTAEIDFVLSGAKHFLRYFQLLPKW